MKWSFSDLKDFRTCPRKWFFNRHVAHHNARDPFRQRAYRLKKIPSIPSWRGTLVDDLISLEYKQSLFNKNPLTRKELLDRARKRFDTDRPDVQSKNQQRYPDTTPAQWDEQFQQSWEEIQESIEAFDYLQKEHQIFQGVRIYTQMNLTFKVPSPFTPEIQVKARPDLVTVKPSDQKVRIYDWKVHRTAPVNFRQQLVLYSLAVNRNLPTFQITTPPQISLFEVQLLKENMKAYQVKKDDLVAIENLVLETSWHMHQTIKDIQNLNPFDVPPTRNENACEHCPFHPLCQEEHPWRKPSAMSSLF